MDAVDGLPTRYRLQVRAGLLDETLKLVNYSAVTHLIIAEAVTWFFWSSASHVYLVGLLAVIAVTIGATIHTHWLYRPACAEAVSEKGVSRSYRVAGLLALVLGLAWATMPIVLFVRRQHT
ncbi:hypothetical protein MKK88_11935 [Methylobacterium sp. E-005]|uniref:hypothetical protein n=1 Tax=Methylobacterium sp. E-005 TaxID=2836549 RepID=UPI001FBB4DF1|nr:hypothetical protein [Methylobacterium sp. E-005]MCJ2086698.1 hypothetical protein [Methylobacterium sp. E-005]